MPEQAQDKIGYYQVEPDFVILRKYIYKHWTESDWNLAIASFQALEGVLYSNYLNYDKDFVEKFELILARYGLSEHIENIAFLVINSFHAVGVYTKEVRELQQDQNKITQRFVDFINIILRSKTDSLRIQLNGWETKAAKPGASFPLEHTLDVPQITEWVKDLILDAVKSQRYPHLNPLLLFGAKILNGDNGQATFALSEHTYIEHATLQGIYNDATIMFIEPIVNYIIGETTLTQGSNSHLSSKQMYFILEICFLVGLLHSTDKNFKTGYSKPTTKDRISLKSLLDNRRRDAKSIKNKTASR
jgi:hypothetical protein